MTDKPAKTNPLTATEIKALAHLRTLLTAAGADWATETQWRSYCDRPQLKIDDKARGFRIPDLLEKGAIEMSNAVFHAPRYGADPAPLAIYRPSA